jgi:hypothetical protein
MDGQSILTVSAAVVALTQLVKWMGIPDKHGPYAVLGLSLLGVIFWAYSVGSFERTQAFAYFAGYIAVATAAAGIFGFTRSAATSLTATKEPPPGAGASPTIKS